MRFRRSPRRGSRRALAVVTTVGTVPFLALGLGTTSAAAVSFNTAPDTVTVAADVGHPAAAQRVGALTPNRTLSLAIALTPRDPAGLDAFAAAVSDPHSPQYHRFLSSAEYLDRFAPTTGQVDQVRNYLAGKGLRVTGVAANRQVVDVTGSAAQVEAAFGTSIGEYRLPSGWTGYAAEGAASVPAALAPAIRFVSGLTDRPLATHAATPAGTGPNGGESPSDLQSAYSMGSVVSGDNGSGRSAGLLEFDGFKQSDIDQWAQHYNLPALKPTVVPVDGGVSSLGQGQVEVTLDIDAVAAYAPAATQYVYEAPNTDSAWTDEWAKVASDNKVDTFSVSWLLGESCDSSPIAATHDSINQMVSQGVTVFSASGDWGAYGCGYNNDNSTITADYPASDPGVTGVGGTHLTTNSDGSYQSESVWNSGSTGSTRSGGGYSSIYSTPNWQTSVNSGKYRSVPDVATAGDPNAGGLAIEVNGGWQTIGGTSESSPLWAGFLTDVVQKAGKRLGSINPTIYQTAGSSAYASDFHDVTQGDNGYYHAGTGYDVTTGWGSPIGDHLIDALTGSSPPPPPPNNDFSIALSPASVSVQSGQSAGSTVSTKVTAGSAESISLSASGLPTGATAAFDPASINGTGSSTVTVSTTSATPAGTYQVTVTGKDTDATHSATLTLTVTGSGGGTDDITNGGFESGGLTGWTSTGNTAVVGSPVHGGSHAAQVGGGNATLSQDFTAHNPALTLYYDQGCTGPNTSGLTTITLTDRATGQVQYLAQTWCGQTSGYTKVSGALTANDPYEITVQNQDFGFSGTSAVTYLDDVSDAAGSATGADAAWQPDSGSGYAVDRTPRRQLGRR